MMKEPIAYINVEKRTLEFAEPIKWHTPTVANLDRIPLFTQRTWVGLTDEEIDAIYEQHHNQYGECESANLGYERAIEVKLKEKNYA
jgi:phage terminase Nu1 subunit (DNA packaging protein)